MCGDAQQIVLDVRTRRGFHSESITRFAEQQRAVDLRVDGRSIHTKRSDLRLEVGVSLLNVGREQVDIGSECYVSSAGDVSRTDEFRRLLEQSARMVLRFVHTVRGIGDKDRNGRRGSG